MPQAVHISRKIHTGNVSRVTQDESVSAPSRERQLLEASRAAAFLLRCTEDVHLVPERGIKEAKGLSGMASYGGLGKGQLRAAQSVTGHWLLYFWVSVMQCLLVALQDLPNTHAS